MDRGSDVVGNDIFGRLGGVVTAGPLLVMVNAHYSKIFRASTDPCSQKAHPEICDTTKFLVQQETLLPMLLKLTRHSKMTKRGSKT